LLPALPDAWKEQGTIKGLKTRGGCEIITMSWRKGKLTSLVVKSELGGNLRLRLNAPMKSLHKAKGDNVNPFFANYPAAQLINNSDAKQSKISLPKTYLYDINTEKGQIIRIL
jgi:alpha-L-fucosidase 2